VPSLFRRNQDDAAAEPAADVTDATPATGDAPKAGARGHTPGKGRATPKRREAQQRRVAEPPPSNRREAYKRMRERQRAERAESREGMLRGDEKHLLPRDKGPERALVRDIIDSRRNVGTWFFLGALVILVGTNRAMPVPVQLGANILWFTLAFAFIVDCVLISRKVSKLVTERHPKSEQRKGSLYLYAIMRSITFRKLRMPKPRVKPGNKI